MGAAATAAREVTGGLRRRLLLDEMLSATIATNLRERSLDVTAVVADLTLVGTTDEDLFAYAAEHRRALVTANISDFAAIAGDWRENRRTHYGLIYVANRTFPQDRARIGALTEALASLCASSAFPDPGSEVFLTRPQH